MASRVGTSWCTRASISVCTWSISTVKVRRVLDQAAGQAGDERAALGQGVQMGFDGVVGAGSVQGPGRGRPGRVELVQVPPQSSDDPCAFCEKVFTVVDQQPDLPLRAAQASGGKSWLA